MQSITFAVPTLTTAQMARQDQIDIVVNQAAAAIVCAWLEHITAAMNKGNFGGFLTSASLVSTINDVQGALRTIP
jgi:hypothetical protein